MTKGTRFLLVGLVLLLIPTTVLAYQTETEQRMLELYEEGQNYFFTGQYEEALEAYEAALALARLTGNVQPEAVFLSDIGRTYEQLSRYDEALDYYEQALELIRTVQDPYGNEATILGSMAYVYAFRGDIETAEAFYDEALTVAQSNRDVIRQSVILSDLGTMYRDLGRFGDALDNYQQALQGTRAVGDRFNEGIVLTNIGIANRLQGRYSNALFNYELALEIARDINDPSTEAGVLSGIGAVYAAQGRYAEALQSHQQALEIRQEIGERRNEGVSLGNIGQVYLDQGRFARALELHEQSLAIFEEINDPRQTATALNNIGLAYTSLENYTLARENYDASLELLMANNSTRELGITIANVGFVDQIEGKLDEALVRYQAALSIAREIDDPENEATALINVGTVYLARGEYDLALQAYEEALAILTRLNVISGQPTALTLMGTAHAGAGRADEAIAVYEQAIAQHEDLLRRSGTESAVSAFSQRADLRFTYRNLVQLHVDAGNIDDAFYYAEHGRALLARNDLRAAPIEIQQQDVSNRPTLSDIQEEQALRLAVVEAQNYVNSLLLDPTSSSSELQAAQDELQTARLNYEQYVDQIQLNGGFLERQLNFDTASLSDVQAALPDDTTLLVYSVGPRSADVEAGSVVFIITADEVTVETLPTDEERIEEEVRAFAADRQNNVSALANVYEMVFAPIADKVTTDRLIIAPDGPLVYIPFAALPVSDDDYLIDRYVMSYTPSATVFQLLNERQPTQADRDAVVMAQPVAPPPLSRLSFARIEAIDVASILDVAPDFDATETALYNQTPGSQVVSISAHAQMDPFSPFYSAIFLGADEQNDGRLEVHEIYNLDMQSTELVILSGCETGSGGLGEDFGVMNRAFFAVGAQQVVSSLWTVDDQATAALLTAFVEERSRHGDEALALQTAMIQTREEFADPVLWASFVLTGLPQ